MIDLHLNERILNFVTKLKVVEERQIYKFFRNTDGGAKRIEREINGLAASGRIHLIENPLPLSIDPNSEEAKRKRLWSAARKLSGGLITYRNLMKAIDLMIEFPSSDISWFEIDDFPHELVFQTYDDITYDVMVFDNASWVSKYSLEMKTRHKNIPEGMADTTNHIAIVDSEEMAKQVNRLDFMLYVRIDHNGKVVKKWIF